MKKAFLLIPVLVLAACSGKDADHPAQTKEWYMQHDTERHTRVDQCKNDAAQQATADCQNALAAQQQITVFGK